MYEEALEISLAVFAQVSSILGRKTSEDWRNLHNKCTAAISTISPTVSIENNTKRCEWKDIKCKNWLE